MEKDKFPFEKGKAATTEETTIKINFKGVGRLGPETHSGKYIEGMPNITAEAFTKIISLLGGNATQIHRDTWDEGENPPKSVIEYSLEGEIKVKAKLVPDIPEGINMRE